MTTMPAEVHEPAADGDAHGPPALRGLMPPAVRRLVGRLGSGLSQVAGSCAGGAFGILTYHRVVPPPARVAAPTYNVTPRRLRTQLEGLLARGFRPWPLGKILDHARERR